MGDRRPAFPFRFWTLAARRFTATTKPTIAAPGNVSDPKTGMTAVSQLIDPSSPASSSMTAASKTLNISEPTWPNSSGQQTTVKPDDTESSVGLVTQTQASLPLDHMGTPLPELLHTGSPSLRSNESDSRTQPTSPSVYIRWTKETGSPPPPQSSSPSGVSPKTQSTPSFPSRTSPQVPSMAQKTSQPSSMSHSTPRSPKNASFPSTKRIQTNFRTKETKTSIHEIPMSDGTYFAATEGQSNPPTPRPETTESQPNPDNSDSAALNVARQRDKEMDIMPSGLSGLVTATFPAHNQEQNVPIQEKHSRNFKVEETSSKEVQRAVSTESVTNSKKDMNDFLNPESVLETQATKFNNIDRNSEMINSKREDNFYRKETSKDASPDVKQIIPSQLWRESPAKNNHEQSAPRSAIYEQPNSVITLAGENTGTSMHLGSDSSKKQGPIHIHRAYKINPDESPDHNASTTNGEGKSKDAKTITREEQPREICVNNNTQSINNSVVFNCLINERNAGVHLIVISHFPSKEPDAPMDKKRSREARKVEVSMTDGEKSAYKATIRRRCLKGLFLEPSDSDTDDTEKPRLHGCLVGCKEREKYGAIDAP